MAYTKEDLREAFHLGAVFGAKKVIEYAESWAEATDENGRTLGDMLAFQFHAIGDTASASLGFSAAGEEWDSKKPLLMIEANKLYRTNKKKLDKAAPSE